MKGRILGVSASGGTISADDGRRYKFELTDWKSGTVPCVGDKIDFEIDTTGKAVEIFALTYPPVIVASGQKQGTIFGVISLICGILGFTPGFGILFAIAAYFLGRIGRAKAIAESDPTGAMLCRIGMILGIIVFVFAIAVVVFGLGFLGLLFGGGLAASHGGFQ